MSAPEGTEFAPPEGSEAVFDPMNLAHARNPHARLAELRRTCPVSRPSDGVVFVAGYEAFRAAARDVTHLSNVGNFRMNRPGDSPPRRSLALTQLDPPQHTAVRRLVMGAFTPATVRTIEPFLEASARRMIAAVLPDGRADLNDLLARPLPALAIAHLTGVPDANHADFAEWSAQVTAHLPYVPPGLPARTSLIEALGRVIAERRSSPGAADDLIGRLLQSKISGVDDDAPLSDDDIIGIVFQLILAGNDTAMRLIANCVHSLLVVPTLWDRVLADRQLLDVAIEESLRHDPPIQWMMRTCRADTSVDDTRIATGERVLLGVNSANRDESIFDHSDDFSLERSNASDHLAFGYGIHLCLGAALGRAEARIAIGALLDHIPDLHLGPGFEYEPVDSPMVRGPLRLDVEWTPRPGEVSP